MAHRRRFGVGAGRGLKAQLWLSADDVPFIDGVRSEHKREVMQLVAEDFAKRCQREKFARAWAVLAVKIWRKALAQGKRILLLISTWRLNRNKAPHWVWLVDMDKITPTSTTPMSMKSWSKLSWITCMCP